MRLEQADTICAIIVAWKADLALLKTVVQAALKQVGGLVLVDHGSQDAGFAAWLDEVCAQGVVCLHHQDNPGLAAGFNRGIEYARAHGFAAVLLLDQDSLLADDMVRILLEGYRELSAHIPVAAVGPQFIDRRNGIPAPFVHFRFPFNDQSVGEPGQRVGCDFLISSGSLIPVPMFEQIGMMDESLFIDNIDIDWCMRATARGFALYGICDAKMQHSIGQRIIPSRRHPGGIAIHSPSRQYYSTRNRFLLYRREHVPRIWVAQDLLRLAGKIIRMSLLVPPRLAHFRAICCGILDGVRGQSGRMPAGVISDG